MVCHFDHFHQFTIHGATDNLQTGAFQLGQVIIVHFVAMTVTLDDAGAAVTLGRTAARLQNTFLTTQTHGATQIGFFRALLLVAILCGPLGDQPHDRVRRIRTQFGRVRLFDAGHVTGIFDHRQLHAKTDPQVWHLVLAGVANRGNLAFSAPVAKPAGHQDGVQIGQHAGALALNIFRIQVEDIDLGPVADARVDQSLVE